MILLPTTSADLPKLISAFGAQTDEVRRIFEAHSDEALRWRPNETKWSVAGHIAHLCVLNEPYIGAMQACVMKNKARRSDGPYKHGWLGPWFARQMPPPPKRRMKTAPKMVPDPAEVEADVLGRFERDQGDLAQLAEDMKGMDIGRARFSSPFMKVLRFSLGSGMATLEAHNRRHIWLAREVLDWEDFPG